MDDNVVLSEERKYSFVVFGRDLLRVPCYRTTFLYSISSYLGVGLITFLFTSNPRLSSHVGFASFMAVTFGYYTNCRMAYTKQQAQLRQIAEAKAKGLLGLPAPDTGKEKCPVLMDA